MPIPPAFLAALLALAPSPTLTAQPAPAVDAPVQEATRALAALEARHGGRLGVAALDTGSGRRIAYRAQERFALCSTHKLLSSAAVLALVDQGRLAIDQAVHYGPSDLLAYAPVTARNVAAGSMTVEALCAAAIEWSDNTAGNLLLGLIGGPAGWTAFARSLGDPASRLDRTEPALNEATPGDPRDTTTPEAMVHDLGAMLRGALLKEDSRRRLEAWMASGTVTGGLLRAGLPAGYRVEDKSGGGRNGARGDVGVLFPPGSAPILVAVYFAESAASPSEQDRIIAEAGGILAKAFAAR